MRRLLVSSLVLGAASALAWIGLAAAQPAQGGNQPPVCCFGPTCQQTGLGKVLKCDGDETAYVLDASGSFDPEGKPLTFMWTSCPGTTIDDRTAAITTLRIDTSQNCSLICGVRLVVSDGEKLGFCRLFVEVIENDSVCPPKPRKLQLTYTGESCSASNFVQPAAGVFCAGDPQFADPVHIVVTMLHQEGRVYFDDIVGLNQPFEINGAGLPSGKVPPNSHVRVFDLGGKLLQETYFHTSCSQPLEVGDQFGSVIITGFTP